MGPQRAEYLCGYGCIGREMMPDMLFRFISIWAGCFIWSRIELRMIAGGFSFTFAYLPQSKLGVRRVPLFFAEPKNCFPPHFWRRGDFLNAEGSKIPSLYVSICNAVFPYSSSNLFAIFVYICG